MRYQAYIGMDERHRRFIIAGLERELIGLEHARASVKDDPPGGLAPGWVTATQRRTQLVDRAAEIQEEIELVQGIPFSGCRL